MRATLLVALLFTGCVTPIVDYTAMSPEQIKELVKDKAMAGNCIVLNTPYGRGVTTNIAIDKAVIASGGVVTIDEQCKMTFTQGLTPEQRAAAPAPSPSGGIIILPAQPRILQQEPGTLREVQPPAFAPPPVLPPEHPSLRRQRQSVPPSSFWHDVLRTSATMLR